MSILLISGVALAANPPDAPIQNGPVKDTPVPVVPKEPEALKVAVSSLGGVGIKPELLSFFTEHFAQALTEAGVTVTTPAQISALIGLERQKQLTGCGETDTSACMTELANALGVDAIAIGDVAKLGDRYQVNLKITGASTGEILVSASAKAANESEVADQLSKSAAQMAPIAAKKLNKPLRNLGRKAVPVLTNEPPARAVKEVKPARHWPLGVAIFGGVGVVVGFLEAAAVLSSNDLITNRSSSGYSTTFNDAKLNYQGGNLLQTVSAVTLVASTALIIGGVALYRGSDEVVYANLAPGSNGGALVFSGVLP